MDLRKQFQELCKTYDIKPARGRGQNFLIVESIYDEIVKAAAIQKSDTVLEVGPGLGFLTVKLAQQAGYVIAVELEEKLAEVLAVGLDSGGIDNVQVDNRNILGANPVADYGLSAYGYKIVANLPYSITSAFLRKYLSPGLAPASMVLLLQKEVAERITAEPGQMSLLAVSVRFYARAEIIRPVARDNFWPEPEVDSAVVKIDCRQERPQVDEKEFFRLVKIGFSSRRRMLKNNLAAGYHIPQQEAINLLESAGFAPKVRAQELGVEDWTRLLPYFAGKP